MRTPPPSPHPPARPPHPLPARPPDGEVPPPDGEAPRQCGEAPSQDGGTPLSCGSAPPQFDEAAGRLGRPYTASSGRTRPTTGFELTTLVRATGARPLRYFGPEHRRLLQLCAGGPLSVAELAAQLRLPVVVTKVVLCDLLDSGAVAVRAPARVGAGHGAVEREVLETLLEGLRRRLPTRP